MTKEDFSNGVTSRQGQMYRIARSYLRSEHDCLDVISEAILKAWQKRETLREEQYFGTWLCRIVIHECINLLRRQKRTVLVESLPQQVQETGNQELRQALDALPQPYRIATVLHYMEGYSVEETARILRVPKGTVSSRLYYARKQLRTLLQEDML